MDFDYSQHVAYVKTACENERLKKIIQQLCDPRNCPQMTSAIGMLPINSAGMRKAVDEIGRLLVENSELVADRDNWRKTAEGHRNFTDELRNRIKKKDAEIDRLTEIIRNKYKRDEKYCVSVNYGTINPFFAILWHVIGDSAEIIDSYYYDSRKSGCLMGDEDYYKKVKNLIGGRSIEYISVDPSAASFIECIKRHGEFTVKGK